MHFRCHDTTLKKIFLIEKLNSVGWGEWTFGGGSLMGRLFLVVLMSNFWPCCPPPRSEAEARGLTKFPPIFLGWGGVGGGIPCTLRCIYVLWACIIIEKRVPFLTLWAWRWDTVFNVNLFLYTTFLYFFSTNVLSTKLFLQNV